ncbi:hypothetical protein PRZ48_014186 [Zasmidium cellare]|uniref:Uncharacterized protein n=1 Tax=Zasmidium cellare TaxID=395010 RepID=A0ABR0E0P7_ZASCE|nr:hypothetical protein PRZ48_014186 [Zasmidium cellare]
MATMAEDNTQSRLLALPRELRDVIYEYTFTTTVQIGDRSLRRRNAGILSTCHQIRAEAIKLYYQRTVFEAIGKRSSLLEQRLLHYFQDLPRQSRSYIRTIHVSIYDYDHGGFFLCSEMDTRKEYEALFETLRQRFETQDMALKVVWKAKALKSGVPLLVTKNFRGL